MRAMAVGLVILMLGSGCMAESLHPTYLETQLVSIPALDGIWRDSSTGPLSAKDEMILTAMDSVTYRAHILGDDNDVTELLVRVGRRQGVTFVDLENIQQTETTHQFALAEITDDRIVLRSLDEDSLKALVTRTPNVIPHIRLEGRIILTGSTEQVQAFLIDAIGKPGNMNTMVLHRVPEDRVCSEMPKDTVSARSSGHNLLTDFGIELEPRRDSSADVRIRFWMPRVRAIGALFTLDDTATSPLAAPDPILSPANPFIAVSNSIIDRRLEIRRIGVNDAGYLQAEILDCHDSFPSSREAIRQLPAPSTAVRFEQGAGYTLVRYMWSPVPGATAYEVLRSHSPAPRDRWPGLWRRILVRDTSFVISMRNLNEHSWRVRAFAPGVGFGPLSPVQRVPAPKR